MTTENLNWRCHTTGLFEEILANPSCAILQKPLRIFRLMLADVAQRCIEINDDKLNLLMMRLTLYDCADPLSENYNPAIIEQLEQKLEAEQNTALEEKEE